MATPSSVLTTLCALTLVTLGATAAAAQDTLPKHDTTNVPTLKPVVVVGRVDELIGVVSSASQGRIGAVDLRHRPLLREGELLEAVPGVIVTQHSGDGKANQYFVRGFNLDHGTDFQMRIEGMPVNMPTHAHGQGYSDLNFLIPEFVAYIDYRLGVYHAEVGDFGSAGGAEFHLARSVARPFVTSTVGAFGYRRLVVGASARAGGGDLMMGGEAKGYDGPWTVPQDLRKYSGLVHYTRERGASRFSLLGLAYQGEWNASDQIPLRAVMSGAIDRFGHIDDTDGGRARRYSLAGSWRRLSERSLFDAQIFAIYSKLDLFSNFTYQLVDSANGDQFHQHDERVVLGGNATLVRQLESGSATHSVSLGVQGRGDLLDDIGLHHTVARVRTSTVREDDVRELAAGVFLAAESRWHPRLRTIVGLRGDAYGFTVTGDRSENSGRRSDGIVSPKASLAWRPSGAVELYLSGGFGFHSNDARGTTITIDPATGEPAEQVDPLVRSRGAEIGVRASPVIGWRTTATAWELSLDSELLFVGDGGTTEPSFASRRRGVTWANFFRPSPQLALDLDLSLAQARFVGVSAGADHIPGALEQVIGAGVTWSSAPRGPFATLRLRHFGEYPLVEDNSVRARSTTLVNAEVGYDASWLRVRFSLLNALNVTADDIQYYYASRLAGETAAGLDDVHFHPVEPRQVRLSVGVSL
jgi:hypothetical protein